MARHCKGVECLMFDEAYVNLLFLITVSHALHIIKARITVGTYHWKIALCKIYYKEKKKERVLALTEYSKQIKSSCKSICRFSISPTCDPCHHRNKHQNAKSFPHKFYTTNLFFFCYEDIGMTYSNSSLAKWFKK